MCDQLETIDLDSSPISSPFDDLPRTRIKVSEMCKDWAEANKETVTIVPELSQKSYHTLSDSDDELPFSNNYSPPNYNFLSNKEIQNSQGYLFTQSSNSISQSSQSSSSGLNSEKITTKEKKSKDRDEKARERAEKAKEKAEREATLEKMRQLKPGECVKYITMILDENIINCNFGKKSVELFQDVQFKYLTQSQKDPFSVTWTREHHGSTPTTSEEKHILFIWSFDKIVTSVKYCTLIETFKEYKSKYCGHRIYFVIYGAVDYYKKQAKTSNDAKESDEGAASKRRKTYDVPKEQINMNLAELEIILKISTRFVKNSHELSIFLQQTTKAIAEEPHRKEIEKRDLEKGWYARGDSRDCVKIDKDLNGMHRLWLQQLSQFNKSSLDVAKSIAEIYPSPVSLYQAYKSIECQKEKELLLQDIRIKKGHILTRRIGPELSRKICLLFSQEDGEIYLSQE